MYTQMSMHSNDSHIAGGGLPSVWLEQVASSVVALLEESHYRVRSGKNKAAQLFDTPTIAAMSIEDYVMRIGEYCNATAGAYTMALLYLRRFCSVTSAPLTERNVHRLFAVCLLVGFKFVDDDTCTNEFFAHVAGMSVKELNQLEKQFMLVLDWHVTATEMEFKKNLHFIEAQGTEEGEDLCFSDAPTDVGSSDDFEESS
eukprot:CAMPEP_0204312076 /NCGR_PEP_ID=MMETSP0469-20131031/2751_1 /ASSEMBLY_ACC=CAM_ASM_000384 /TAXON_ID=2969 /ORGANISM="Oxyrrhis marina" /LENGTH=199 /DNA_ID=CAMNT_0051292147 /DNA_START=41 /DNA_END=640 /DNA_ORIENTATION=-